MISWSCHRSRQGPQPLSLRKVSLVLCSACYVLCVLRALRATCLAQFVQHDVGPSSPQVSIAGYSVSDSRSSSLSFSSKRCCCDCSSWNADTVFAGLMAPQPPFLVSQGTYVTFNNSIFHSVHISATQLLDVSHFGTVSLVDTLFANTSLPLGVVGTYTAEAKPHAGAEYAPHAPGVNSHADPSAPPERSRRPQGDTATVSPAGADSGDGRDAHLQIRFSPAPPEDVMHFGAEFVAHDETVSDCRGGARAGVTLPGCPPISGDPDAAGGWGFEPLDMAEAPVAGGWTTRGGGAMHMHGSPASVDVGHGECWEGSVAGGGVGEGVQQRGLGFCVEDRWQPVALGEKLSVQHPWLATLAQVCTVCAVCSGTRCICVAFVSSLHMRMFLLNSGPWFHAWWSSIIYRISVCANTNMYPCSLDLVIPVLGVTPHVMCSMYQWITIAGAGPCHSSAYCDLSCRGLMSCPDLMSSNPPNTKAHVPGQTTTESVKGCRSD